MRDTALRAALFGMTVAAGPALAADPALVAVTLSSGGVGQFEFAAEAEGRTVLPLDVPLDQVDDVLKSLRVDDPAGTPAVRLPGRQPLAESFRTLPFTPAAFESPHALLAALVGEAVRIPASGVAGTILAVSTIDTALPNGGGTQTRHQLAIATAAGLETLVLEDTPGLEFASERLRGQIAAALGAIAAQRVQDRRTVQLGLADGGRRAVRFGYVVPVPVWKASYRLTVPEDGGTGPAMLQGFAVVENLSGRDWRGVQVTLTSGQPVLFHQRLYEAVFTTRPEAPVDVANRLVPEVDPGSTDLVQGQLRGIRAAPPPPPSPMAAPMGAGRGTAVGRVMAEEAAPAQIVPQPAPSDMRQSVAQVEFRLADPVTAASGESLMLPIVSRAVPVRRVALYQPEADPLHPLVALLLRNDGAGAMPPGVVTLFERRADGTSGFIGDARLPAVQPGEERLASFAADLATRIEATRGADLLVTSGKVSRGVLELVRRERATTTYRITAPAASGRTVLIEQPKRQGWTLAEPDPATAAGTPTQYRITREVPAGTTQTLTVVLERPRGERLALLDQDRPRLLALSEEGRLSPELRAALVRGAALRAELDRRQAAGQEARQRRNDIVADQDRVRRNLAAVPPNSELQRRYLAQLQQQEAELATLGAQIDAAQAAAAQADAALKDYLGALNL